jgi:hypothetical protein
MLIGFQNKSIAMKSVVDPQITQTRKTGAGGRSRRQEAGAGGRSRRPEQ